jgi:two-component system sensor histidine kinase RegB
MADVTNPALDLVSHDTRSDWVRLRTLLVLRWLAILGQTVTVVTASFYLGLGWSWGFVSSLSAHRSFPT